MQALELPPIAIDSLPIDPAEFDFRRVVISGTFDNDENVILRHQRVEGQPGVALVTPLHLQGLDAAVLVNRGWLPRGNTDPSRESREVYNVEGSVTIEGVAHPGQTWTGGPRDPELKPGQERLDAWFRIDIARIEKQLSYPLLPIYIDQLSREEADPDALPRPYGTVQLDEGSHFNYAMQWFSFALILTVTYIFFVRQELQEEAAAEAN